MFPEGLTIAWPLLLAWDRVKWSHFLFLLFFHFHLISWQSKWWCWPPYQCRRCCCVDNAHSDSRPVPSTPSKRPTPDRHPLSNMQRTKDHFKGFHVPAMKKYCLIFIYFCLFQLCENRFIFYVAALLTTRCHGRDFVSSLLVGDCGQM